MVKRLDIRLAVKFTIMNEGRHMTDKEDQPVSELRRNSTGEVEIVYYQIQNQRL